MSESTPPPAGGHKPLSKRGKIAVAAAAAGVAGLLWYRSRQNAAAAAVPASDQVAPGATDPLGMSSDTGPGVYGATGTASSTTVVGNVSTNADWYASALSAVEDAGYDAGTAATALGAYLAHQPLTAAQQTIVRIGLAAAGTPPVGTFTIITAPTPPVVTPPSTTPPKPATNVLVRTFVPVTADTTWSAEALSTGAFAGNGNALYQYNVLPGKHSAPTLAAFRRAGAAGVLKKGNLVALPVSGKLITLPGVGTVTT